MTTKRKISKLLTARQVADIMLISPRQVLRLPITRVMIGARTVRYHEEDVHTYIEGQESSPCRTA